MRTSRPHHDDRRAPRLAALIAFALLAAPTLAQEPADEAAVTPEVEAGATRKSARNADKRQREAERKAQEDARKETKRRKKERTEVDRMRERFETSGKTAVEWYADAKARFDQGKYLRAREILLPLEDSPRALDIQEKVKLLLADTYFYQGGTLNLAEALARYRTFLTFYPQSTRAEYVQFQIASSYFRQLGPIDRDQSYTDNAIIEYQRLLDTYPSSEYAEQSRRNMLEAKARRAQHDYQVGKFYWEWHNYDAAADRFAEILKERPELPQREETLYLAAESFYRSGNVKDGDAHAARLAQDHPGSAYLSRLSAGSANQHAREFEKREAHRRKELERTHRHAIVHERKRTRQVRKDSGLPGKVPTVHDDAGRPEPTAAPAPSSKDVRRQAEASEREAAEARRMALAERREESEIELDRQRSAGRANEQVEAAQGGQARKQAQNAATKAAKKAAKKAKKDAQEAERMAQEEAAEERERVRREEKRQKSSAPK